MPSASYAAPSTVSIPRQRKSAHAFDSRITILGVPISALSGAETLSRIADMFDKPGSHRISYANAASLNIATSNRAHRVALSTSAMVLNDGLGIDIAAKLQGREFAENLNGTDFTPRILRLAAARGKRVFLLGGRPGVADLAKRRLEREIAGLEIVGCSHGFLTSDIETAALLDEMKYLKVDIVVVGMGVPVQELWLAQNLTASGAKVGIAVGAFIDFSAGEICRAPSWVRRLRSEWIFRLAREPKRLFRRYVLGNPQFLVRIAFDRRITT